MIQTSSPLCLFDLALAGSTFLQRFYRVHCTMNATGITDHRARLLRLIESQVAFHVATRNHAGQTLLHTICSKDTYSVKPRLQYFFVWMYPHVPERYEQTSTNNRTPAFSDELCTLLLKHGADFNVPDKEGQSDIMMDDHRIVYCAACSMHRSRRCAVGLISAAGFIPLVGLIECVKAGLIRRRLLSDLLFPAPDQVRGQSSAAAPSPAIDLNVADASGSNLLTLLFDKWSNKFYRWDWDPPMLAIADKLCDAPRLLAQVDLFAQNERGQCAIQLLAQACRDVNPRRHWWLHSGSTPVPKETLMLPQRMLKAWQEARAPLLRLVETTSKRSQ